MSETKIPDRIWVESARALELIDDDAVSVMAGIANYDFGDTVEYVRAEPFPALGAIAMQRAAAGKMDEWAAEANESIDTGHPSGMNVAREIERDFATEAAEAIRAIPLPDHAALLADALRLPEIAALVAEIPEWLSAWRGTLAFVAKERGEPEWAQTERDQISEADAMLDALPPVAK